MAGRPGRSGGHNRLTPEAHLLRGTFKPGVHFPATPDGTVGWQPKPAILKALGPAGRAFLTRQVAAYAFSPLEGDVAVEMAVAADRLAELRAARADVDPEDRARHDKRELAWAKVYTTGVQWLRSRARLAPPAAVAPAKKWAGLL